MQGTLFIKRGFVLYLAEKYIYEISKYKINKVDNLIELLSNDFVQYENPLKIKKSYICNEKTKQYVIETTIDWIGAPLDFLEKNGFVRITTEEYIEYRKKLDKLRKERNKVKPKVIVNRRKRK